LAAFTRRVASAEKTEPWKAARRRYGTTRKQSERDAMLEDIMAMPQGGSALFLYGGGIDIDWVNSLRPDLRLTAVERDKALWPAMDVHAAMVPFEALKGDLADVRGSFDLVFADTCSEVRYARAVLVAARNLAFARPVDNGEVKVRLGTVYLTVMGSNRNAHEGASTPEFRVAGILGVLNAGIEGTVGAHFGLTGAALVHEYRQAASPLPAYLFRWGPSVVQVNRWEADILRLHARARSRLVPSTVYDMMTLSGWRYSDVLSEASA